MRKCLPVGDRAPPGRQRKAALAGPVRRRSRCSRGFIRWPLCVLLATSAAGVNALTTHAHGPGPSGARYFAPAAQEPAGGDLSGQVLVGDLPADSGIVVLHRVSARFSGEIDSVGVGTGGAFELRLPEVSGDETEDVFFATFRYQDVLYIGEAFTARPEAGAPYLIQAYPAIPAGPEAGARVRVRNLLAEPLSPGPGWAIADYFELGNDQSATIVASEDGPSWSHALPPGATDFRVGQSDLPAGAASLYDGRVHVSAPMQPGVHVYLFRYTISADRFSIPMEGTAGSMELLVREPAGELSVTGLANVPEVELEGGRYRRFAGRGMAPSVVTVARGGDEEGLDPLPLAAILLTLALAGVGAFVSARSRSWPGRATAGRSRREVLVAIAGLDEQRRAGRIEPEDYEKRRARLIEELDP